MPSPEFNGLRDWLASHGCRRFKIVNDHLMCTCPIHKEDNPSFGVCIDRTGDGWFNCFACQEKGKIWKLIRYLEGRYADVPSVQRQLTLGSPISSLKSHIKKKPELNYLEENYFEKYITDCSYWYERGITDETIKFFSLGYDPGKWAVTIPVRKIGTREPIGVCFRFVDTHPNFPNGLKLKLANKVIQKYHYLDRSQPLLSLFGQETIQDFGKPVYLFEGAIDVANFYQYTGHQALSCWGSFVSPQQRAFLKQFTEVRIVADNDKNGMGQKSAKGTRSMLCADVKCNVVHVDGDYKDFSEAVVAGAQNIRLVPLEAPVRPF